MSKKTETFNGRREWPIACRTFELKSVVNNVDIETYDAAGRVLDSMAGVGAGTYIDRRGDATPVARIAITTGANEAVSFFFSEGYSGDRSVPSSITSNVFPLGLNHTQAKVTVGVASTVVLAANAARRYLSVQNQHATANVWIRTDGAAAVADGTCVKIPPGGAYEPLVAPLGAIRGIRDTADADCCVIEA